VNNQVKKEKKMSNEREFGQLDKLREECGVFGVYAPGRDVAKLTYFGLYALQHRGQESAGIAVSDGETIKLHREMGLVSQVFNDRVLGQLQGHLAVGHVRYSTTGSSLLVNAQPLVVNYVQGMLALAHNGNLTNARRLRRELERQGSVFQTTIDSEVIVSLLARLDKPTIEERIIACMQQIQGAYSLVLMTENKLIGVRDPHGFRPLCLGRTTGGYILASESCALDTVGAEFIRDLLPGEMVVIDANGVTSYQAAKADRLATCIFEFIYFARPDSNIDGINIHMAREEMGRQLAREHPTNVDLVVPVPDSGIPAALGFAAQSGVPFATALIKNRYIGRTFIQPEQQMRDMGVAVKLNPIRQMVQGKRIALIDDSIVRGTTSRRLVAMLREAGAEEVHLYVSSPPITHSCYYGIDTSARGDLIASTREVEQIRQTIGADGLYYLSMEGLLQAVKLPSANFCTACFCGTYPTATGEEDAVDKFALEKKDAQE